MKAPHVILLAVILASVGCTPSSSPSGREAQFRKRLAECTALREWKAQVHDVRFSADRKRALVLLELPAYSTANSEVVLVDDGFQRYRGDWGLGGGTRTTITVDLASR